MFFAHLIRFILFYTLSVCLSPTSVSAATSLENFVAASRGGFRNPLYYIYRVKAKQYISNGRNNVNIIARVTDGTNPFEIHFHVDQDYSAFANVYNRANVRPLQASIYAVQGNRERVLMPCQQDTEAYAGVVEQLYRAVLEIYNRERLIPQLPAVLTNGRMVRPVTGTHDWTGVFPNLAAQQAQAVELLSNTFKGKVPKPPAAKQEAKEEKKVCKNPFEALDDSDDDTTSLLQVRAKLMHVRQRIQVSHAQYAQQGVLVPAAA